MKYLKLYNEANFNQMIDGLLEFTKDHLAYLLDNKFATEVKGYNTKELLILIRSVNNTQASECKLWPRWNEIEDHFIPFIELLQKQYIISNYGVGLGKILFYTTEFRWVEIDIEEIINNTIPSNLQFTAIRIFIKK